MGRAGERGRSGGNSQTWERQRPHHRCRRRSASLEINKQNNSNALSFILEETNLFLPKNFLKGVKLISRLFHRWRDQPSFRFVLYEDVYLQSSSKLILIQN